MIRKSGARRRKTSENMVNTDGAMFGGDEMPTAVETPQPTMVPPAPDDPPPAPPADDPQFNGIALSTYRLSARALLEWAVDVDGHNARSTSDPIYLKIVEGRRGPGYSSCGDLGHWLLYRLGVRAPWINRAENKSGGGWHVGLNLNRLVCRPNGPNDQAFRPKDLPPLDAGDVYVIMNRFGGHVICVREAQAQPDGSLLVKTSEYGQPGGAARTHTVKARNGSLWSDANQVISVLQLDHALGAPGMVAPDQAAISTAINAQLGRSHAAP